MKSGRIVAAGVLFFSLCLVTVAVQDRVVLLRRELYRELLRVQDLKGETLAWWWKLKKWSTPEGRERLARLLGRKIPGKTREERPASPAGWDRNDL